MLKRTLLLILLATATLFAIGCDDSTSEGMAIFGVSDINGNDPVVATAAGTTVDMTFRWRPYFDTDAAIVEAAPHGDYVVDSYRVTWTAVTTGATAPSPRETATQIFVPVYDLVTAGIIVATAAEAGTVGTGNVMNANIEFTAHEMGSDKEATFSTKFAVTFN
jgi:hypothetical protein